MALPFFNGTRKKRDQMLAMDLGSRITKVVHLQRLGQGFALCGYALLDAPIFEKTLSPEMLAEHLKAVTQALNAKTRFVTLTMGVDDALVRHSEMPRLQNDDLRAVLKHNSRAYLQQELSGYVYDCHVIPPDPQAKPVQLPPNTAAGPQKQTVLVTGAKKQLVDDLVAGAKSAGLVVDYIVPGLIGPVNAFERAMPAEFANEVVALVDLGFRHSTICVLNRGELGLSRVVNIGGDKLTQSLVAALNISYAEAEGIKIGMPAEILNDLESQVVPLGRELRASIDFFEHQHDRPVTQIFMTGGATRSPVILQILQRELLVDCKVLNPTNLMQLSLPPQQAAEIEQVATQLTVALGAAMAAL